MKPLAAILLLLVAVPCFAADLTGNWVVRDPLPDGTFRTTYLDLHQEGSRITGSIRVTQFYFKIIERDRKSTRLNSSHSQISYAVFCLKKTKEMCMPHV